MNNGRENRNNGNQEKGKEEKEALRSQYEVKKGDAKKRPLSFCGEDLFGSRRGVLRDAETGCTGDPSLRLKNGCAQDDAT